MINSTKKIYIIFGLFIAFFCTTGGIFSYVNINTFLWILPPIYSTVYTPSPTSWAYTTGPVYIEILGSGIKPNETAIFHNGTYSVWFYRWTWPFITWAAYSSGNLRTYIRTTHIIDRIDDIWPTFLWVSPDTTYTTPVTITYSDNFPGATATVNGSPFANGWIISTNGTYQLIVTDTVGHTTWATFIIYLNETQPSWWWGGGISLWAWMLIAPICKQRSCYSTYYDEICGSCIPPNKPVLPSDWPPHYYINPQSPNIDDSSYPKERNDAYIRAYHLGITTIPTIQEADMNWLLFRKFAAKMVSEFAVKVIGRLPDKTKKCIFTDIDKENLELQYYIKRSCQLGIMWLDYYGNPDTTFNPNYFVTRAQLVTILSRLLFKDSYNIKAGEITLYDQIKNFVSHTVWNISNALGISLNVPTIIDWYTKHLAIIKNLWIITDYRLTIKEMRWYLILIMYRIDKLWVNNVQKFDISDRATTIK